MIVTKRQLLLSLPGLLLLMIGLLTIAHDVHVSLLMIVWGGLMTPVFWEYIEARFSVKTTGKHKFASFLAVMLVVVIFSPSDPAVQNIPFENMSTTTVATEKVADGAEGLNTEVVAQENSIDSIPSVGVSENERSDTGVNVNVVSVVDGDTVKIILNNKSETVRVIGINTPETVHPSKPVECFGVASSNKAKELLFDKSVQVVFDETQGERDKYGRLLAYLILPDGKDFGRSMIDGGFAYEYTYNVPYKKQDEYKEALVNARNNKVGLWASGACDATDAYPSETIAAPAPATDSSCSIKGNISSDGEKIYHTPGQQYYSKTIIDESDGERWFCTEAEAQAAGWRRSMR